MRKQKQEKPEENLILKKHESALITEDGVLHLLVPRGMLDRENKDDIPDLVIFLSACFLRFYEDEEFCEDMGDWWRDQGADICTKQLGSRKRELH